MSHPQHARRSSTAATVMLVDDHRLVREAVANLLEATAGCRVVARLDGGEGAVATALELRPSLVLLDVEMPGRSAFDIARDILAVSPKTKIAFLTGHEVPSFAAEASRLGAAGFLHKSSSPEATVKAIHDILAGERVFESTPITGDPLIATLTPREREVLTYIARGLNTREMADLMCLSPKTVGRHVERLMAKVGIHQRVKLAAFARRAGIIVETLPAANPDSISTRPPARKE